MWRRSRVDGGGRHHIRLQIVANYIVDSLVLSHAASDLRSSIVRGDLDCRVPSLNIVTMTYHLFVVDLFSCFVYKHDGFLFPI